VLGTDDTMHRLAERFLAVVDDETAGVRTRVEPGRGSSGLGRVIRIG
jgi:hypothetical protein